MFWPEGGAAGELVECLTTQGAWSEPVSDLESSIRAAQRLSPIEFLVVAGDTRALAAGVPLLRWLTVRGDPVTAVIASVDGEPALRQFKGLPVCSILPRGVSMAEVMDGVEHAIVHARRLARAAAGATASRRSELPIGPLVEDLLDTLAGGVERHRRVLACLLFGLSNKEMVDRLALHSEDQVKKEVGRVLRRIGSQNRSGLFRSYLERRGAVDAIGVHTHPTGDSVSPRNWPAGASTNEARHTVVRRTKEPLHGTKEPLPPRTPTPKLNPC